MPSFAGADSSAARVRRRKGLLRRTGSERCTSLNSPRLSWGHRGGLEWKRPAHSAGDPSAPLRCSLLLCSLQLASDLLRQPALDAPGPWPSLSRKTSLWSQVRNSWVFNLYCSWRAGWPPKYYLMPLCSDFRDCVVPCSNISHPVKNGAIQMFNLFLNTENIWRGFLFEDDLVNLGSQFIFSTTSGII